MCASPGRVMVRFWKVRASTMMRQPVYSSKSRRSWSKTSSSMIAARCLIFGGRRASLTATVGSFSQRSVTIASRNTAESALRIFVATTLFNGYQEIKYFGGSDFADGPVPYSSMARTSPRFPRAFARVTRGYGPWDKSFSLPKNVYFCRHSFEPPGFTCKKSPKES